MLRKILASVVLAALSTIAFAVTPTPTELAGEVVRVIDGDTIDVLIEKRPVRVRLADIDAPERGQAFGEKSRQYLADIVFRQRVRVVEKQTDRYGRTLGMVYVRQCAPVAACWDMLVNAQMIAGGMAWAYRFHDRPSSAEMAQLEQKARRQRIGLWSDPNAVEPWQWRRTSKQ